MITFGSYLASAKVSRCGFLPFTVYKNELWFLFARHKVSKDLGDWAGGIRKNETALAGGLRELHEESKYIFVNEITINDCVNQIALVDGVNMATIFVSIDPSWIEKAEWMFLNAEGSDEISEAVWISESKLYNLVYTPDLKSGTVMWRKIRTFFKKIPLWSLIDIIKVSVDARCRFDGECMMADSLFRLGDRLITVSG